MKQLIIFNICLKYAQMSEYRKELHVSCRNRLSANLPKNWIEF